ncbi:MAG: lipid A biosynthesis acyltransferase [Rhodocyclaceae bacterium]|nr:lipid A biosynthesis acyltransferase [Rhodocyclaceae bacterium]
MTRLALALMWLLHGLPYAMLAGCGRWFGRIFWLLSRERREVALTNLRLCFPQWSERERVALAKRHFEAFGKSFLDRSILWWASPRRIRRLVSVRGMEHLEAQKGRPVLLLAPHFVGLDMGWTRLALELDMVSLYANQKNPLFNAALYRGRTRFGRSELLSRQEGLLRAIRAMKSGKPFYYLPDMDYGPQDALFVPFFGVPAATITGLSRIARITGAVVLPVITRQTAAGYEVEIQPPWSDFPGTSIAEDTRRMNAYIEDEVRKMPEQYFWLHKRFKTRPPKDAPVYRR